MSSLLSSVNYFEILGIDPNQNPEQIQIAIKTKKIGANKSKHPDVSQPSEQEFEELKRINAACDTLSRIITDGKLGEYKVWLEQQNHAVQSEGQVKISEQKAPSSTETAFEDYLSSIGMMPIRKEQNSIKPEASAEAYSLSFLRPEDIVVVRALVDLYQKGAGEWIIKADDFGIQKELYKVIKQEGGNPQIMRALFDFAVSETAGISKKLELGEVISRETFERGLMIPLSDLENSTVTYTNVPKELGVYLRQLESLALRIQHKGGIENAGVIATGQEQEDLFLNRAAGEVIRNLKRRSVRLPNYGEKYQGVLIKKSELPLRLKESEKLVDDKEGRTLSEKEIPQIEAPKQAESQKELVVKSPEGNEPGMRI